VTTEPMLSGRTAIVLSPLAAAAFVGTWNLNFLAPVLPSVAEDVGVSISGAGQLVTASALATIVFLVLLAPLSDKYGRRPLLMIGLAGMALAALGSALTSSYALLMALRILSGISDALVIPSAAAAVADYFSARDRTVALNVLLVPAGAAAVVGLPVVALVDNVLDWHAAFVVFAACTLGTLASVRWLLPRAPDAASTGRGLADHYRDSYAEVVGTRSALAVLLAAILGATVWGGMVTYAGAFFEDLGLSGLFAALGASYVLGGAAGAFLARGLAPRRVALLSALAAGLLLLPAVLSASVVPLSVVFMLAFAASRAPAVAAINNMLLDLAPGAPGTAISTYAVVASLGGVVGAASGGVALAVQGYVTMASLFTVVALVAALLLVSAPRFAGPRTS